MRPSIAPFVIRIFLSGALAVPQKASDNCNYPAQCTYCNLNDYQCCCCQEGTHPVPKNPCGDGYPDAQGVCIKCPDNINVISCAGYSLERGLMKSSAFLQGDVLCIRPQSLISRADADTVQSGYDCVANT